MEEQRVQAYAQLIDRLLSCPNGQESVILQQNSELVDEGFFQIANYYAQKLREDGKEQAAVFLFDLVQQLSQVTKSENRQQAYLQLIQELLECRSGEEEKILQANPELIDIDLIETMERVAEKFEKEGNSNSKWLRNVAQNLTQYLSNIPTQDDFNFLLEIMETIRDGASQAQVNLLLQQNIDKINLKMSQALQIWAGEFLKVIEPEFQHYILDRIDKFSTSMAKLIFGNREVNLEIAISGYDILRTVSIKNNFLQQWAATQYNLGNTYCHRIAGNKKDNLESAIAAYNSALQVYIKASFPIDWARTQTNLGTTYSSRIAGDRKENLELAIAAHTAALQVYTKADFSQQWARTQRKLGIVYNDRVAGDKEENLELAIAAYNAALQVYTKTDFPQQWAETQHVLGLDYSNSIAGDRRENLELAIAAYNAALQVYTKTDFPQQWARTQNNLGAAYSNRIAGKRRENLELAISAYTAALKVRTEENFPTDWAATHNNLGAVYSDRIAGDRRANLELAIAYCTAALRVHTEENFPADWAEVQNNLGVAYSERIAGKRRKNLELAIAYCTAALRVQTEENFPTDWATTQNNLGGAYSKRIVGDTKENIELAIAAYTAALRVHTEENFPTDWATTQNNLGGAYSDRIEGDRKENIELAIASYTAALRVHTEEGFPSDWATIQSNLGRIYRDRIEGNRKENIELAIAACTAASRVYTEINFPQQWAMMQNSLGMIYRDRIAGDKKDNLELAIAACNAALRVYTEADFPYQWAMTQNSLGIIYKDRIAGDKKDNLELAIAACNAALKVYTKADFPQQWAGARNNLGIIYKDRIVGDRKENLESSIKYYNSALTIYTPKSIPINCFRSAGSLGNLHFEEGQWLLAIKSYNIAIEAVEQSREWASNDRNKQEIISNAIAVYQNIVQACINLGQIDKAIEYVERGKARNLVDLLATKDLYPKGDIPEEIIARLRTLRQEAIAEEKRLSQQRYFSNNFNNFDSGEDRRFTDSVSRNKALDTTRFNLIRQELDNLIAQHIQLIDPSFKLTQNKLFSFEQIQKTLPTQQTALIEWFIGNGTLSAFIVTSQRSIPVHFSYTEEQLNILVNTVAQYFDTYVKRDRSWQTVLPDLLTQLAENLQLESIVEQIKLLIPDCNQLILVPHRWLHLLPIHALPLSDGKCFLDLFPQGVSYAPSIQLLQITQIQNKPQLTNFFAVQNPTEDLDFTNVEVQAVRSQFQPHDDVLEKEQATKSALSNERLGQANLTHFSCHGYFNFEKPELSALLLANSKVETSIEKEDKEDRETRYLPSRDGGSIDLEQCLTLGEIFSYDLTNCRLVTLSACETGLTDFKSLSDEYVGLPSGFLYAGSPSVVSSLWAVSDISTSFLMIKFYQNLQEIDSVPVALNQAQLWLRSITKEELQEWKTTLNIGSQMWKIDKALMEMRDDICPFDSPYYWGAFCAIGS